MPTGGVLAILDSLTGGEVVIVLLFALMVLGPERLPEVARTLGEWAAKIRRISSNLQHEMRDVLDDPAMQPLREVGEFVAQPRKKLVDLARASEMEAERAVSSVPEPDETTLRVGEGGDADPDPLPASPSDPSSTP